MFIFNKIFPLTSLTKQDILLLLVTKKSTNLYVQIISPHLKRFCVSSKHSEGMQPTIQHPIPFINFQNNWL